MAVALLTTLYGAVMANALFLPLAGKLETRSREEVLVREMIIAGVMAIQSGDSPRIVEEKLKSFLMPRIQRQLDNARDEHGSLTGGRDVSRKCKCPPPEMGIPAWVVTYGDMMSLLLTFFILLLSFSSIQEAKFKEAMESLQGALGVLKSQPSVIEQNVQVIQKPRQTDKNEIMYEVKKLEQFLIDQKLDKQVEVAVTDDGIEMKITDSFLFRSGDADLQPQSVALLDRISQILEGSDQDIAVSGHTDSVPIHNAHFPSNWELSSARAVAVARFFQRKGVAPQRLSAVGYGEYRPEASNDTPAGRAKNRRVEIYLKMAQDKGGWPNGLPLETIGASDGG